MKKLLRIDADILAKYLGLMYIENGVLPAHTVIDYQGVDWGNGVLLFSIEHEDIVEDVEVLAETELTDEEEDG